MPVRPPRVSPHPANMDSLAAVHHLAEGGGKITFGGTVPVAKGWPNRPNIEVTKDDEKFRGYVHLALPGCLKWGRLAP